MGPRLAHAAVLQAPRQQLQSLLRCTGASDLVRHMHTTVWLKSCRGLLAMPSKDSVPSLSSRVAAQAVHQQEHGQCGVHSDEAERQVALDCTP